VDRAGVSSGRSTGGDQHRREGPNVSPRDDARVLATGTTTAVNPSLWRACRMGRDGEAVRLSGRAQRRFGVSGDHPSPRPGGRPLGELPLPGQPCPGAPARRDQPRCPGSRRHDPAEPDPGATSLARMALPNTDGLRRTVTAHAIGALPCRTRERPAGQGTDPPGHGTAPPERGRSVVAAKRGGATLRLVGYLGLTVRLPADRTAWFVADVSPDWVIGLAAGMKAWWNSVPLAR
jgi:hypothetical protein